MDSPHIARPVTKNQPAKDAPTEVWINWFCSLFLPEWIERASDPAGFGFYDLLDLHAKPIQQNRRSLLAQARLLYTFSHLAQVTKNPAYIQAAHRAFKTLSSYRNTRGGYCRVLSGEGQPTGDQDDKFAYSYDQSFVILGLVTWDALDKTHDVDAELESCWSFIDNDLTDLNTGLLLEHNGVSNPAQADAPNRAQNPHMHLYEAALQAYEITRKPVWLERAIRMRSKGIEYFYDRTSGTITEFLTPDLKPLPGRDGQRREIGHQCEWAWLLRREVELGGNMQVQDIAESLLMFADTFGFATDGVMQGAAFDAVSSDTQWREDRFLLWPQTEAIKTYAIRSDNDTHAQKAASLTKLVFQKYFSNNAAFINQVDNSGTPLWPEALSRLLYHLVLAMTEGARAELWTLE